MCLWHGLSYQISLFRGQIIGSCAHYKYIIWKSSIIFLRLWIEMYYIGGTSHRCCCLLWKTIAVCVCGWTIQSLGLSLSHSLKHTGHVEVRDICVSPSVQTWNMEVKLIYADRIKCDTTFLKYKFLSSPWSTEPVHRTTYMCHRRTIRNYVDSPICYFVYVYFITFKRKKNVSSLLLECNCAAGIFKSRAVCSRKLKWLLKIDEDEQQWLSH